MSSEAYASQIPTSSEKLENNSAGPDQPIEARPTPQDLPLIYRNEKGKLQIAEPYRSSLSKREQKTVLEAAKRGEYELAQAMVRVGCGYKGEVWKMKMGPTGKPLSASAVIHLCKKIILCCTCTLGRYLLKHWLSRRDPSVLEGRHVVVELKVEGVRQFWPPQLNSQLRGLLKDWHSMVCPEGYGRFRILITGVNLSQEELSRRLRLILRQEFTVKLSESSTRHDVRKSMTWAFSALEWTLKLPVKQRVELWWILRGERRSLPTVWTTGSFYSPLPEKEILRRHALQREENARLATEQGAQYLKLEERHTQSMADIYKYIQLVTIEPEFDWERSMTINPSHSHDTDAKPAILGREPVLIRPPGPLPASA